MILDDSGMADADNLTRPSTAKENPPATEHPGGGRDKGNMTFLLKINRYTVFVLTLSPSPMPNPPSTRVEVGGCHITWHTGGARMRTVADGIVGDMIRRHSRVHQRGRRRSRETRQHPNEREGER